MFTHYRAILALPFLLFLSGQNAYAQAAVEALLQTLDVGSSPAQPTSVGQLRMFSDMNYWSQKDTRPGHGRTDSVTQPQVSFEYRFSQSVAATFGGNYWYLTGDKFDPVGDYRQKMGTIFGGLTFYLPNNYNINVTGGALRSSIYETRPSGLGNGFAEGHKINRGSFVSVTLNANYNFEKGRLAPFANVLYYSGVESAGLESDGYFRPENPDALGRITVGTEAYYRLNLGKITIEPMVRAGFMYDYRLLRDWRDRTSFDLGAGFNVPVNDKLTAAFRVLTIVGRDDYRMLGVRGSLYYQF